jgi:hypothetical protein
MRAMTRIFVGALLAGAAAWSNGAAAQSTKIEPEYLMTYVAYLDAPQKIDDSLYIFNARPGGWAKGPKISGTFVSPSGDWLQVLPSGALRLDVRATLKTDDGAYIYLFYNGVIQHSAESAERLNKGEVLTTADIPYFVTAPTFRTSSEKYAWLNRVQAINKVVEVKLGEGSYVKYDVFVIR